MADKENGSVTLSVEGEVKEKEVVSPSKEEKKAEEKAEKENGETCEAENGKIEEVDDDEDEDSKEADNVCCPIKRKSVGDVQNSKTTEEGASPEKKAKLDEVAADAESNGEAEAAA